MKLSVSQNLNEYSDVVQKHEHFDDHEEKDH